MIVLKIEQKEYPPLFCKKVEFVLDSAGIKSCRLITTTNEELIPLSDIRSIEPKEVDELTYTLIHLNEEYYMYIGEL